MSYRKCRVLLGAMLLGVGLCFAVPTWAIGPCCNRCGTEDTCHKVCRLVKDTKNVQVTCWGCESEDFCIPCRSQRDCKNYDAVCEDDGSGGVCGKEKRFVWWDWISACRAQLHTKKKLMKRTVTKTIPTQKWVVEDLCDKCQAALERAEAVQGLVDDSGLPPVIDAAVVPASRMQSVPAKPLHSVGP